MKRKIKFNMSFDAPVSIGFCLLAVLLFLLNTFLLKNKLSETLFVSPTRAAGELAFKASEVQSYFRMLFFVFGEQNLTTLLYNVLFIVVLGAKLEESYGSTLIGVGYLVSVIFTGVLAACLCLKGITGFDCLVVMAFLLTGIMNISGSRLPISTLLAIVIFFVQKLTGNAEVGITALMINLLSGCCGALLVFILSPVFNRSSKKKNKGLLDKAEKIRDIEEDSPRFKKKKSDSTTVIRKKNKKVFENENDDDGGDDDTTVVGTLTF